MRFLLVEEQIEFPLQGADVGSRYYSGSVGIIYDRFFQRYRFIGGNDDIIAGAGIFIEEGFQYRNVGEYFLQGLQHIEQVIGLVDLAETGQIDDQLALVR